MQFVDPPPPAKVGKATSAAPHQKLKDDLDGKVNLSSRGVRRRQQAGRGVPGSVREEDVRVTRDRRHVEIGMIENVEELRAELQVEVLRNSPDVVVLEHGEVHLRCARSDQNIAAGIASNVSTFRAMPAAIF